MVEPKLILSFGLLAECLVRTFGSSLDCKEKSHVHSATSILVVSELRSCRNSLKDMRGSMGIENRFPALG